MNATVGIFAGRGDVILAMALAVILGIWLGWMLRKMVGAFEMRKYRKRIASLEKQVDQLVKSSPP